MNLLFSAALLPQTFHRQINPIPFIMDGVELQTPFLGGFNKPNPQFLDWDNDGLADAELEASTIINKNIQ